MCMQQVIFFYIHCILKRFICLHDKKIILYFSGVYTHAGCVCDKKNAQKKDY